MIKRTWTAAEADEWTKEDWVAIVLSPIIYICVMVGTALSLLLLLPGFILLCVAVVAAAFMHWVIDPKLKAISHEYEQKQAHYIEELERNTRWESKHG
ncbi:MAG: hypothetical protein OEV30_12680 [Ignavibacteria bacterium]|nr:hypothetical protein [Ignavibacteria bacterium]